MKKKLITLMLVLTFLLFGCTTDGEAASGALEQTETESPTPAPTVTPSPTPTPTPLIQEPAIEKYSDEYVSFEYDKDLFTVNLSDDKLTISIECPTMPDEPEGTHNTVMGIITQPNQYISEISESDVYETLEMTVKAVCQELFKLNEGESIVNESTKKYSDGCIEYNMEINDGSQCYVKALNYNTDLTMVILRICDYSKDYNDAFMDIYNSSQSELGNYDFSAQISEATPTPEATPVPKTAPTTEAAPAGKSSSETDSPVTPDTTGNTSAPNSTTSGGQSSINSSNSTNAVTENSNQTADINQGSSNDGNNFNTYDNAEQQQTEAAYVLNTHTMKIHLPACSSVKKIAPQNYATSNSSIEELEAQGYSTCGICFR